MVREGEAPAEPGLGQAVPFAKGDRPLGRGGAQHRTLNIWGDEAKYTAEHWKAALDRFACDGLDRVYFWVSGHFPSKEFPQTYRCKDGDWDSTVESGIPTIKDQKAIIRHAHDMGLTIYLGSGLGGWVGTGLLTNKAPGTMKQGPGIRSMSLCPSSPVSRKALIEYYKEMSDPRFEYMEARGSWGFPGPGGRELPVSYFSPRVMHWSQHYNQPLEAMVANSNRIVESGFYGYAIAYEPGAGTGWFYREIPFDPNTLPYALTGFVYREMTWDPTLSLEQMQARVQERFFGREAPEVLGRDIWALQELIRACAGAKELTAEQRAQLDQIDRHIREAKRGAGPKTLDGLRLMEQAVHDMLRHFGVVK